MASQAIYAYYNASGYNTTDQRSHMWINISYNINVSGTTATATFSSIMRVKRDGYGPSKIGPNSSVNYGSCWIEINGVQKNVLPSNPETVNIGTDWVVIGQSVTHTVTYDAKSSKTVQVRACFGSSPGMTVKLQDLRIPTSEYTKGTAQLYNNSSTSIILPAQSVTPPTPTYTKCSAPTNITCFPTSGYYGTTTKVSWSGASAGTGTSISGYKIYWMYQNFPENAPTTTSGWEYSTTVTTTSTSGSYNISINRNDRVGFYLVVKIVTLANNSSYNSDISTKYGWCLIESIPHPETPDTPYVSANKTTINKGESVTFTISYNADYCYYSTSSTATGSLVSGHTLTLYPSNTTTYYFYAQNYKNNEYANSSRYSITITVQSYPPYPPSDLTIHQGIFVEGIQGNDNATLYLPTSYMVYNNSWNTGNYKPTQCEIQILTSTSYSTVLNNGGNPYNLGTINLTSSQVSAGGFTIDVPSSFLNSYKGYYCRARARFYNSSGYSDYYYANSDSGIIQIPTSLQPPTITMVKASEEGLAAGLFSNSIDISWINPTTQSGNSYIKSVEVIYQSSSNGTSWGSSQFTGIYGNTGSALLNDVTVTYNFTPGLYYKFGIRMIDKAGYIYDVLASNMEYVLYCGFGPELSNEVFSVTGPQEDNLVTIRPYTNTQDITFSSVKAISDNPITYTIDAYIEQKGIIIPILTNTQPTSIDGDTVIFQIKANDINTLLKNSLLKDSPEDLVWNSNFTNVKYRIYAKDNTGMTSTINSSNNTQIKFIEAPNFIPEERIRLGIKYSKDNTDIKIIKTDTQGDFNIANERMFNPGESIYFNFNKATDYNDDIIGYKLFVNRLDTKPSIQYDQNYLVGNFVELKTYNLDEIEIDNNEISIYYPITQYTQNKFLIFAVAAIDSKNNLSNYKYSETYLVGCRVQNATINLIKADLDNNDNKLKFTYIIPDLGGSLFINSQIYTYSQYPNFERNIQVNGNNYIKKARISLEYCLDGNFNNTDSNNYGITSIDYNEDINFELIGSNDGQPITIATEQLTDTFLNKKLYARLKLITSVGFGTSNISGFENLSINITNSSIITYYADAPTVSHRAQHVGINTNNFDPAEDEIFVVSDFGKRDKIKFSGTNDFGEAFNIVINVKNGTLIGYDTSGEQTILIDLKNKIIDGAKISGGSW